MTSPYCDAVEAAEYLRFIKAGMTDGQRHLGLRAFYEFERRRRTKLRPKRRGGRLLFLKTALDAVLEDAMGQSA